ncbi:ornithine carbamoyltransferase [Ligilactobacillus acidipiscis DSM 15836]|uniref:Ornithine carbamoyltransferase n=2 Tax=Ligilactobacillus acidipiscis TaxID=89059 RepID=A0A0R2JWL3_9LACO|nr:ornithine carbamoyltransferase [Ligilactobacillus acidipiscis]KRM29081.1 ornithine carbamoyltransferase [Ligilactobacillus acidipiscis DSM 15836]KRN81496.1 ornithine carbamoyltransferase [Ligilactobacillus acidipiscis]SFV41609.1 Ornithine carbamoyltransferase [Ligilactobacillus acidipiscis]GAW64088.1 ornithine/putrescine carbamoyltransferase [Ligilactobacillus acidipiscis]GEN20975.1 ornithine carbamoyltransferase, catabolic [Ligilactobacillus acidipiscis]
MESKFVGKESNVFQGRSILSETSMTPAEMEYLINFGLHLKFMKKNNIPHRYLEGKNIALLFEKASTRTRSSFVTAAIELGAHPDYLGKDDIHLGKKESVEDTAKILGSMFDGIEFRGFKQETVDGLAKYSGVPVWNGLTDEWHPTQTIPDLMTMKENFGRLKGLTLTYIGDGRNNVANSLLVGGSMVGVNVHVVTPKALYPSEKHVSIAKEYAAKSGAQVMITDNIEEGVKGSNAIYTDVWVSMGESDWEDRVKLLKPYQVNMELMKKTGTPDDQLIFMHCLPAFHDTKTAYGQDVYEKYGISEMEVTDEVFRSKYSRVFEEGENRKHGIKAIMAATLGNLFIPSV